MVLVLVPNHYPYRISEDRLRKLLNLRQQRRGEQRDLNGFIRARRNDAVDLLQKSEIEKLISFIKHAVLNPVSSVTYHPKYKRGQL